MNERPKEQTLAEIAAASYECRVCGFVYDPEEGDPKGNIEPGTPFEELSADWRCPVCNARRAQFSNIGARNAPSGFQQNLNYGLGVNNLTPAQKNLLIFGALALGILFFLSLYGLN